MPKLADFENCTGCGACMVSCSKNCITMRDNGIGVVVPFVDTNTCIECHACERSCPAISPEVFHGSMKVYAAWNNDMSARSTSASGGIASAIYDFIKKKGGYTIGAVLNADWSVDLVVSNPSEDYAEFKNSKYTFSSPYLIYSRLRELVKEGALVVLIGLPCQIAGFRKKLGDKDNIIYIDLVCHGVTPNSYLKQHIAFLEKVIGEKAYKLSFRAPEKGTANYYFTLYDNNNNIIYSKRSSQGEVYNYAFHRSISYRENCYNCHYARPERCSDITIGDYHGLGKVAECEYDENEVSVILVNTPKGDELISDMIKSNVVFAQQRPLNEPIEGDRQLRHPSSKSIERIYFEKYISQTDGDFEAAMRLVGRQIKINNLKQLIKQAPRRVARKILNLMRR